MCELCVEVCKPHFLLFCLSGGGEYSPVEEDEVDWKDHTFNVCCCALCCPCEVACHGLHVCGLAYQALAEPWRARRRTREETVTPLPEKRPRVLSPPPPAKSPASTPSPLVPRLPSRYGRPDRKAILTSQQAAPFFKLSTELREMIYRIVIGDYAIYIVWLNPMSRTATPRSKLQKRPRMGCLRTKLAADQPAVHAEPLWPEMYMDGRQIVDPKFASTGPNGGLLPLLKTCKRVYAEAIGLLYSSNRFIFMRNKDLTAFRQTILPQRANAITTVQLQFPYSSDSNSPCIVRDVLSSFNKLRTLDINFNPRRDWSAKYNMEWLLGIIPLVSDDVTITVVLRWATTGLLDRLDASTRPNLHVVKPPESEIILPSGEGWAALRIGN